MFSLLGILTVKKCIDEGGKYYRRPAHVSPWVHFKNRLRRFVYLDPIEVGVGDDGRVQFRVGGPGGDPMVDLIGLAGPPLLPQRVGPQ